MVGNSIITTSLVNQMLLKHASGGMVVILRHCYYPRMEAHVKIASASLPIASVKSRDYPVKILPQ